MRRAAPLLTAAVLLMPASAASQDIEPRTADYGFITTLDDARALWVNPAGLAAFPEASVMGELLAERPGNEGFRVGQFTVGFNSRGVAFGYQRDLHPFLSAADVLRLGAGAGFTGGAVGIAFTTYSSNDVTRRGVDLGLRLDPAPSLTLGGAVRHLGRPTVRGTRLPVTGIAGVTWTPLPSHVQLSGEALAAEQLAPDSGYALSYRVGARVSTRGRLPLGVLTTFELGSNARIDRWSVGIAVGGNDQVVTLGSVVPLVGQVQRLHAMSLTGVASRRFPRRQF